MSNSDYLNSDEAAAFLGITRGYLHKLTSSMRIKFYKPGGKLLFFKKEDLVRYIERGENEDLRSIIKDKKS